MYVQKRMLRFILYIFFIFIDIYHIYRDWGASKYFILNKYKMQKKSKHNNKPIEIFSALFLRLHTQKITEQTHTLFTPLLLQIFLQKNVKLLSARVFYYRFRRAFRNFFSTSSGGGRPFPDFYFLSSSLLSSLLSSLRSPLEF